MRQGPDNPLVMAFFDPPPSPPEPERFRPPEWFGPPDNVLGVAVPLRLQLARTERAVVAITGCDAYPHGAVIDVSLRLRPGSLSPDERRSVMHGGPFHLLGPHVGADLPPELVRLGVLFRDGRKATSLDGRRDFRPDSAPDGPILTPRGGGGGELAWNMGFWLWPVPPPGLLTFVVEWPALGIPETRTETDGTAIGAAAASAEPLWPDDDEGRGAGGWSTVRI
jgi:hypothetical protein